MRSTPAACRQGCRRVGAPAAIAPARRAGEEIDAVVFAKDHAQAGELVSLLVAEPDLFLGQQVDVGAIQRRDLRVEDARPVRRRDGIQFFVQGMQFAAHRAQGDARSAA